MSERFLRTDNKLIYIVCLSFLCVYAWACTHPYERTVLGFVRSSSFVHTKKGMKNYGDGKEN